ncbi:glycoside hydrolase [Entophlyctis helioformis]|nr:glycoside hydrolase [Entophlyctis helioformis]
MLFLGALVLASSAAAAVSVDLTNPKAVDEAVGRASRSLAAYYRPNFSGAIPDNPATDASGRQWYESGVMWGSLLETVRVTRNTELAAVAAGALSNASYAPANVGSFLGPQRSVAATLLGRWNDDIGWYGLAALTGAELFGKDAKMPRSQLTYYQVALKTFDEMYEQWDTTSCGGGIFWSRDRVNPKTKDFKSAISNSQAIMLAARLYILSGDRTLLTKAQTITEWFKTSRIQTASGNVLDGISADRCRYDIREYSYNSGMLVGALAWLYKATNDPKYIADAGVVLNTGFQVFSRQQIITDLCEGGNGPCTTNGIVSSAPAANQSPAKGTMIRGIMYLYMITPDARQKSLIRTYMTTSFNAMLATCDDTMHCNANWLPGSPVVSTNFHYQLASVELFNAISAIYADKAGNGGSALTAPVPAPGNAAVNNPPTNAASRVSTMAMSGVGAAIVAAFGMLFF